jgi:hypothetical protein
MSYQTEIIRMTEAACRALFQAAHAVPAERLEWKPSTTSRHVLNLLQECALVPLSFAAMLNARAERYEAHHCPAEFDTAMAGASQLTTVAACEDACRRHTQVLLEVIRAFPEEDLHESVAFTNPGIAVTTVADMMRLHYWNCVYHTGQINYIQTLYGDLEFH